MRPNLNDIVQTERTDYHGALEMTGVTRSIPETPSTETKTFSTGDVVKVRGCELTPTTGIILSVSDQRAVVETKQGSLFEAETPRELTIGEIYAHMQIYKDADAGMDTYGQFQSGEVVQINDRTVGVIVRLDKDNSQVLDNLGRLIHLPRKSLIKRKRSKFEIIADNHSNILKFNDLVKVIFGPYSGREGRVKYIYKSFVFAQSPRCIEYLGLFVCRSLYLLKIKREMEYKKPVLSELPSRTSRSAGKRYRSLLQPSIPNRLESPTTTTTTEATTKSKKSDQSINDFQCRLQHNGKMVRVCRGPYKSNIGIIKDITNDIVELELYSNGMVIPMHAGNLLIVADCKGHQMEPVPMLSSETEPRNSTQYCDHDQAKTARYSDLSSDGSSSSTSTVAADKPIRSFKFESLTGMDNNWSSMEADSLDTIRGYSALTDMHCEAAQSPIKLRRLDETRELINPQPENPVKTEEADDTQAFSRPRTIPKSMKDDCTDDEYIKPLFDASLFF